MTILRLDAWQAKPGRMNEIIQYAAKMKPLIEKHGGKSPRLMRIAVGGPSTGLVYGEFQVADLEEHGRVIGKLTQDDEVMQPLERFYRSDGPVESYQSGQGEVIAELGKRTESIPGCVEEIRSLHIPNESIADYLELAGELATFTDRHDARVRVLRGLTGDLTGQISQVLEFADMAAFGRYADDVSDQPSFKDLVNRIESVVDHLDASLHAEVMT